MEFFTLSKSNIEQTKKPTKFNIPSNIEGEVQTVHVVEAGEFSIYTDSGYILKYLAFCVDPIRNNLAVEMIDRIRTVRGNIKKTYSSDVVIEKVNDQYIIVKSRYGKIPLNETLYAEPIF